MNHLKIHAYVPVSDLEDDFDANLQPQSDDGKGEKKPKRSGKKRKRITNNNQPKVKQEVNENENYDNTSGSRSYNYVDEDVRYSSDESPVPRSKVEVTATSRLFFAFEAR